MKPTISFKAIPDRELVILWHLTNMSYNDKTSVLPAIAMKLINSGDTNLWKSIDVEVKARGIDPHTLTKSVTETITKTVSII